MLGNNVALKNAHAGKRCFIVGNGPSLKAQDITLLENEICIVTNRFFCHPDSGKIKPAYWILADPGFYQQPETLLRPALEAFTRTGIRTSLFVPSSGHHFYAQAQLGPSIELHFFRYDDTLNVNSEIDFSRSIPQYGQNVVAVGLMLAFHLGCSQIYLLGCDHDFMGFTEQEYQAQQIGHFYEQDKNAVKHLNWEQWQAAMARMTFEYRELHKYGAAHGREIFNATDKGHLELFPRVAYESLFSSGPATGDNETARLLGLFQQALDLIRDNDCTLAMDKIDAALELNAGQAQRVEGLEFLKAHCFAQLGIASSALYWAKQDFERNPGNRAHARGLIEKLTTISPC